MSIQPVAGGTQSLAQPGAGSTPGTGRPVPVAQGSPAPASQQASTAKPSPQELQQATDAINRALQGSDQSVRFSIDHDTGTTMVKVVDSSTDEVIRQVPSDEVITIARSIDRLQGLILTRKA